MQAQSKSPNSPKKTGPQSPKLAAGGDGVGAGNGRGENGQGWEHDELAQRVTDLCVHAVEELEARTKAREDERELRLMQRMHVLETNLYKYLALQHMAMTSDHSTPARAHAQGPPRAAASSTAEKALALERAENR
jgi:hypothetical protein